MTGVTTSATLLRCSHRLRISIQGFDIPHLLPPLTDITQLAPLTLYTGDQYPSVLTLPTRK